MDLRVFLNDLQGLARHTQSLKEDEILGPAFFPRAACVAVEVHLTDCQGAQSSSLTPLTITQHASWVPKMQTSSLCPEGLYTSCCRTHSYLCPPTPVPSSWMLLSSLLQFSHCASVSPSPLTPANPSVVIPTLAPPPPRASDSWFCCQRACLIIFPSYLMALYVSVFSTRVHVAQGQFCDVIPCIF